MDDNQLQRTLKRRHQPPDAWWRTAWRPVTHWVSDPKSSWRVLHGMYNLFPTLCKVSIILHSPPAADLSPLLHCFRFIKQERHSSCVS